jgi:hypothetical protein
VRTGVQPGCLHFCPALRGRLPTDSLKRMAQEGVAHQFDKAERLESRVQVAQPARR